MSSKVKSKKDKDGVLHITSKPFRPLKERQNVVEPPYIYVGEHGYTGYRSF